MTTETFVERRKSMEKDLSDRVLTNELNYVHLEKLVTKIAETVDKTLEQNVSLRETVNQLATAVESNRQTTKDQCEVQTKLLDKINLIDIHNGHIEQIKIEQKDLKTQMATLTSLVDQGKGSWTTITIICGVITFGVSIALHFIG